MKTRTPTLAPEVLSGSAKIMAVEKEVDRVLNLLRAKIHERGYTQLKVQRALGWGRTYISQLFRKQKSLRFDQILQILEVVEIDHRAAAAGAALVDVAQVQILAARRCVSPLSELRPGAAPAQFHARSLGCKIGRAHG